MWATGLAADAHYLNDERAWLLSPRFNLSQLNLPQVLVRMWLNTEYRYDGVAIEFLLSKDANDNSSWIRITPEYNTTLWHRVSALNWTMNEMGFTGNTNGPQVFSFTLPSAESVFVRFIFSSDEVVNHYPGFGLDFVQISEGRPDITTGITTATTASTTEGPHHNSSSSLGVNMIWLILLMLFLFIVL